MPDPSTDPDRIQAWIDSEGDGIEYRRLLDERGIQHPTDQPIPDRRTGSITPP